MVVTNARYEFVPESPICGEPMRIVAHRDCPPGQKRERTVWLIRVPQAYRDRMADRHECTSYVAVIRDLATAFCNGDRDIARHLLVVRRQNDLV
jgi:hypothetical protein